MVLEVSIVLKQLPFSWFCLPAFVVKRIPRRDPQHFAYTRIYGKTFIVCTLCTRVSRISDASAVLRTWISTRARSRGGGERAFVRMCTSIRAHGIACKCTSFPQTPGGERKNNVCRTGERLRQAALCRIHFRFLPVIFIARYAPVTFAVFTTARGRRFAFRPSSVFRLLITNNSNKHCVCRWHVKYACESIAAITCDDLFAPCQVIQSYLVRFGRPAKFRALPIIMSQRFSLLFTCTTKQICFRDSANSKYDASLERNYSSIITVFTRKPSRRRKIVYFYRP